MKFNRILNLTELLNEETIDNVVPLIQRQIIGDRSWKDLSPKDQEMVQWRIDDQKYVMKKHVEGLTTNPTYRSWVYRMLANRKLSFPEDVSKTQDVLKKFDKVKTSGNFTANKNIMSYNTFGELHQVVSDFQYGKATHKTADYNGNPVVAERDGWKIVELDDYERAKPLLEKTGWCVRDKEWWDNYETPYHLISKNDVIKLLMHIPSAQLKDVHDDPVVAYNIKEAKIIDKRKADPTLSEDSLGGIIGNLFKDLRISMDDLYGDFIWMLAPNKSGRYALAAAREHPEGPETGMAIVAHVVDNPDIEMMSTIAHFNWASEVMLNKGIIPTLEQQRHICERRPDSAALAYAMIEHGEEVALELLMSYAWYSASSFANEYEKIGYEKFNETLDAIIQGHEDHNSQPNNMIEELGKYVMKLAIRLADGKLADKAVEICPVAPYRCIDTNAPVYPPTQSIVKAIELMPEYYNGNSTESERRVYDLIWIISKKNPDILKDEGIQKVITKYPRVMEYLRGELGVNEYTYMSSDSTHYPF